MRHWTAMPFVVLVATALGVMGASLSAHHSVSGQYDASKPLTLTGVITKVDWINPHVYLHLDVKEKDGAVTAWRETERVAGSADETLTDAAVLAAVKARMIANRDVTANQIDVDVKDRVVTLRGRVDGMNEAQLAVRLALDTRGVDRVISYLTF